MIVSNKEVPVLSTLERPKAVVRSVQALLADPGDLPRVFTLLEALSFDTLARIERRLAGSEGGRRLLAERPNLVAQLEDREALRRLPAGSLGRAYLAFLESEGISAAGIRDADAEGRRLPEDLPPVQAWLNRRLRDSHDLWHTVTGYQGDVLGEVALLAFSFAQTGNPGIGLLVTVGLLKTLGAKDARDVIVEGFRRGRRAAWLPEQPWETMLATPIDEVRARLGVGAPPAYTPVRVAEMRMAMAA
jgi:ubiquinone biosynthesis protein COQ4